MSSSLNTFPIHLLTTNDCLLCWYWDYTRQTFIYYLSKPVSQPLKWLSIQINKSNQQKGYQNVKCMNHMVVLPHPTKLEGWGMLDSIHSLICICLSVCLSVCRWSAFRSTTQVCSRIWNFLCMFLWSWAEAYWFSDSSLQDGHRVPILDFRFPDCNLRLDLYINSKLQN